MRERRDERHRAAIAVTIIMWTPVAQANRPIDNDGSWLESMFERAGIDVGFKRRAGLAHRVGRAIELAAAVVATADHSAHRAVDIHEHGGCLAGMIFLTILAQ